MFHVIFQFLASVNYYLFICYSVGCEVRCVDTAESTNIAHISVSVFFMINFSIKETFNIWMLSFLEVIKYLT